MTNEQYEGGSRAGRIWYQLGSARTVRIIFVAMLLYFLIIGGLVLGYSNVQSCLATYSDQQAVSSKARSDAASVDRRLNARYDELSTLERSRSRADQQALLDLIKLLVDGRGISTSAVQVALEKVEATNKESIRVASENDDERKRLDQQRASADALRTLNPVPDAPSEHC